MMWASRSSRLKWLIVSAFFTWLFITENFQNANADVETLIDDIAKVLNRNSSRQEILKTLKQHKKEKLRLDTFAGWERWGATYSNCNADINPNLSPIEIDSKKVTPLKKGLAVLIYSDLGTPANCLYLSSDLVKQTFEMEAVNIMVAPICREFITTISGAGGGAADFRYFKGAVFYFTNSQVEPERSLHQIDGRKFDMEIEIEFTDRMGEKSTLLHVMVEALPPGNISSNILFQPLEEAVEDLKKKMAGLKDTIETKEAHLNRLEEACLNAEKEYFELMALEIEQLNNTAYVNQFNKLNKMFHDIHEMTNAKYLALQGTLKSIQAATEQSAQNKIGIMEDVDKLKVRNQKGWARSKEQMKREKEVYEARKKKDASLRKAKLFAKKSVIIQEDLKTYEDLFAKNSIGVPGGKPAPDLKYDSPDKLVEELKSYSGILDAIETAEKKYLEMCDRLVEVRKSPYNYVPIQTPFQISWLFPTSGGHYMYNGSRSIPNCNPVQHSIVFEKPLQITTDQLAVFRSIPSKFGSKVDKMIPVLRKSENRSVWYVKNNIYYRTKGANHFRSPRRSAAHLISENHSGKVGACTMHQIFILIFACINNALKPYI